MRARISLPLSALLLAVLTLAGAGCAITTPEPPAEPLLPLQEAGAYHGLDNGVRLLPVEAQDIAWTQFLKEHFNPWERTEPANPAGEVSWGLSAFADKALFGENNLPRDPGWLQSMAEASRVDAYPSLHRRAVAVADTSMRVLPTNRPAFYDPAQPGEGFPFDYMQNSLVQAGTPLLATHTSTDGAWVLVESRFAYGWVPATEIAWVDDGFAAAYRTGTYAALTREQVPVIDEKGRYLFTADIGTLLPVAGAVPSGGLRVIVPVRDHQGGAVVHYAVLAPDDAQIAPIPATPGNFARLADALLGEPYGWGGLYGDRDCSALTMDLLAGFGIFLPRNSSQQSKLGSVVSLEGLDREAKKQRILAGATPFLTLVRKPGHIMLYIGEQNGQPMVLHAIWGLKTRVGDGFGRNIIGRAVITTLEPGLDLPDLARPEGVLLETVRSMTTLP